MKFSALYKEDFLNGEGLRVSLFVSGCSHGCEGCHNPRTHNPKYGEEYTDDVKWEIIAALEKADGLTLSGGDPLFKRNIEPLTDLVKEVKSIYPEKNIWMWTGHTYQNVKHLEILKYVDVLIDGKYDKTRPSAPWRGSDNQQIIYLGEPN